MTTNWGYLFGQWFSGATNVATGTLQTISFANRQPDPAFQALETPVFTSDLCKERETIPF